MVRFCIGRLHPRHLDIMTLSQLPAKIIGAHSLYSPNSQSVATWSMAAVGGRRKSGNDRGFCGRPTDDSERETQTRNH